jgi:uncharacterized protein YecT (DUF1311 family)
MPDSRVTIAVVLVMCLLSTPAIAACSRNEHGVFEDVACAAEASARADKELGEVYKKLLSQLGREEQERLRASQRAWLAYRKANIAFVYAVEGNGSAGRMVAANQAEQATLARLKELRSWVR